ncbi:hypothetical protein [Egicoccus sp. AB-alg2]|uniref:hypothetical protein n=1 Tax=Egicoccus sp. AB-alg2 TaxID=3242693 RepID=UPI00359E1C4C
MDETRFPAGGTALADVPSRRSCTRCDGEQHLIGGMVGLGKYRCDHCAMTVGFDLEADPAEFLIDRGSPSRYTKDVFGSRLVLAEHRL